jgi:hypothetical protein
LLKSAVSDYIDRIVNRRGPRQRVITQPRPDADIASRSIFGEIFEVSTPHLN